jgi:hypothetical protein
MRSTAGGVTVRLYHLADGEEGGAQTLMYGPLQDALMMAAQQSEDIQADLFIATDNDVIAYLDLIEE